MTDRLVSAGVAPREKFSTVYSGMDVTPFLDAHTHRDSVRRELGFADHQIVVGKIARLFHLKGHEYVIRAAADVIRRCPQVHFLFVGDGILRPDLQRQIAGAGLSDHFHFTGLVSPQQIAPLMGAMDLLIHASLREGLARALPQALIAGKPVISYDIDGAREVVIPDITGHLLAPRSIEPLADAIVDLAQDADKRQRLGQTGRDTFHQPVSPRRDGPPVARFVPTPPRPIARVPRSFLTPDRSTRSHPTRGRPFANGGLRLDCTHDGAGTGAGRRRPVIPKLILIGKRIRG